MLSYVDTRFLMTYCVYFHFECIKSYKVIANVNEAVNQAICSSDSTRRTARQVQSTNPNFISFTVMEMAARDSASEIFQAS